MLPGPRLVLAAIVATLALVVLGFAQLVKLQVAHGRSAGLAPVEARFAGLAFTERADWTPVAASRVKSLELLAPFANIPLPPPVPSEDDAGREAVRFMALTYPEPETPSDLPSVEALLAEVASVEPIAAPALLHASPLAAPEPAARAEAETGNPDLAAFLAAPAPETVVPAPTVTTTERAAQPPADPPAPVDSAEAAPIPESLGNSDDVMVLPERPRLDDAALLTASLPDTATEPAVSVPLPARRPGGAQRPQHTTKPTPAKRKAARKAVRKREPPASAPQLPTRVAPSNPFSGLFGGSSGSAAN
jgi:hypothetical protein